MAPAMATAMATAMAMAIDMRDWSDDVADQENRKLRDMAYRDWQAPPREPLWPIVVAFVFGVGAIISLALWLAR